MKFQYKFDMVLTLQQDYYDGKISILWFWIDKLYTKSLIGDVHSEGYTYIYTLYS